MTHFGLVLGVMFLVRIALAVFVTSATCLAQRCTDIRTVDVRNIAIHSAGVDENELTGLFSNSRQYSFQFKDGVADLYITAHLSKQGSPDARAKIVADTVVDTPGGPSVSLVQINWEHLKGSGAFQAIVGLACSEGEVRAVFQFSSDGVEFRVGPGDQIEIKQAIWNDNDRHCCPSQTRTVYYGWDVREQKFRRLRVEGPTH